VSEAVPVRIAGTGPIALACALFLVRRGVPAARIATDGRAGPLPQALAARAIALSQGSLQLLGRIASMPQGGRIGRVEVSVRGHAGRTRIDAHDLGVPELGRVVRYGALLSALEASAGAHRFRAAIDAGEPALVVHADGDPGDCTDHLGFDQSALLLEVEAPQARADLRATAFERFTAGGPLALLPLPEPARWSVVWCDAPASGEQRARAAPIALAAELQAQFGDALGPLTVDGARALVPLARRARRTLAADGQAWIGNAAQSLHPVAGQGLNLGVRDAFELADALAQGLRRGLAPQQALQAWSARRRTDRGLTIALTDLMAESFTWPLARGLQSPLLTVLDAVPALRRPLASQLTFGRR